MDQIVIDINSVVIVCYKGGKMLGSGFVFLRTNYVVTAKHVVFESSLVRENLAVLFDQAYGEVPVEVVMLHPELDIAVLELSGTVCQRPLEFSPKQLAESKCFFTAGYKPSLSTIREGVMEFNIIEKFTIEKREREFTIEESLMFSSTFLEGGHSGGPVFADDGKVIALVVEGGSERDYGRAAPIAQLLNFYSIEKGFSYL